MSVILFRVDERLIHGQVVVAWAARLRPSRLIVVNDELAGEPAEQAIYRTGLTPGLSADFWTEERAIDDLATVMDSDERVIVLADSLDTVWRLAVAGVPIGEVNVGGLHAAQGKRRVLPYVCLSPDDEERIRDLEAAGVVVTAQDVPTAGTVRLS